ncbi:unnamed protein product [Chrysoparadoxa australica]
MRLRGQTDYCRSERSRQVLDKALRKLGVFFRASGVLSQELLERRLAPYRYSSTSSTGLSKDNMRLKDLERWMTMLRDMSITGMPLLLTRRDVKIISGAVYRTSKSNISVAKFWQLVLNTNPDLTELADKTSKEAQNNAASKIQAIMKGRAEKKAYEKLQKERAEAAIRIESLVRQRQARCEAQKKKEELAARHEAATRIEGLMRVRTAKQEAAQRRKRKAAADREAAALKIERRARQRQARKEVERKRKSKAGETKGTESDAEEVPSTAASDAEREAAALKIESLARQRRARKEVERKRKSKAGESKGAVSDAEEVPSTAASDAEREAAALKIESLARQRQARKEVERDSKGAVSDAEEVPSTAASDAAREAAALKIESLARQRQAKREVERKRMSKAGESKGGFEAEAQAAVKVAGEDVFDIDLESSADES